MKNSRTYKNIPLINPHHCALPTCHVVEGIGTFLIGDDGDEYEHHSSELLLQVTINGEIRGVIEEPTNVEDYFYVCGDSNDAGASWCHTNIVRTDDLPPIQSCGASTIHSRREN